MAKRPEFSEPKPATLVVETNARVLYRLRLMAEYGLFGKTAAEVAERLLCERLEQIEKAGEWLTPDGYDWARAEVEDDG